MIRSRKMHLTFCVIWLLLFLNSFYWGTQKEGYYIDELWSYGLANSCDTPFLQERDGYMDHWHGTEFYESYLTVSSRNAFSYASVYDNQVHDVHPPFYYMLLHTICSLFTGKFSKWFGLSVNYLFWGGAIWLLYEISGLMMGQDNYARLIPPVLYGISGGGIATVLYIRMYMMLVFWGLLFVYLTFLLMEEKRKKAISYAFSVIAGTGMGVLVFPAALNHIFIGEKGKESLGNVFRKGGIFLDRFGQYVEITAKGFFFGKKSFEWIAMGLLLLGTITFLVGLYKKRLEGKGQTDYDARFWILMVTLSGYFIVVTQISTDIVDRYQFMVYPVGILLAAMVLFCFFKQIKKEKGIWIVVAACLLFWIWHYDGNNINYIYPGYGAVMQKLDAEYRDVPGIYVTAGDHLVINNSLFLAQHEMTYPVRIENLEKVPEICREKQKEQLVLYVDIYFDEYQVAEETAKLLGYSSCSLLYDNTFSKIFCLSR